MVERASGWTDGRKGENGGRAEARRDNREQKVEKSELVCISGSTKGDQARTSGLEAATSIKVSSTSALRLLSELHLFEDEFAAAQC